MSEFKTNVMRILEKAKIDYAAHEYPHGKDAVDGISVAKLLGQNPECVFKTLVTKVTGYIRGGCSPIGMKKQYPTVFHESCLNNPNIIVSAGKIGYQIDLDPQTLIEFTKGKCADIIK